MRLVPQTSKLLAQSALSPGVRFGPSLTRLIGRCGAAECVPHLDILRHHRQMLEHPESETLYHFRNSSAAVRAMLVALERFPVALGRGVDAQQREEYVRLRGCVSDHLLSRALSLGAADAQHNRGVDAHLAATMGETLTEVQALQIVAAVRENHNETLQRLLAVVSPADDRTETAQADSHVRKIILGQSMLDMLSPIESLLKIQPPAARREILQRHVDIPHTVRVISESLCSLQAQGTRSTDLALCFLLTLLDVGSSSTNSSGVGPGSRGWWDLVSDDRWIHIFQNLSLMPNSSADVQQKSEEGVHGVGGRNSEDVAAQGHDGEEGTHVLAAPFASAFEATIACPAMMAVLSSSAPAIVKRVLSPVVQRDLMVLMTHLHSTGATLALSSEFLQRRGDDEENQSRQRELCRLLDEEYTRLCGGDGASSLQVMGAGDQSPTTFAPHSLSLSIPKKTIPHPEGYLLLRSLLQQPLAAATPTDAAKEGSIDHEVSVPKAALQRLIANGNREGSGPYAPVVRCAAGSDMSFLTANVAVAAQRLGLLLGAGTPLSTSSSLSIVLLEHLYRARSERRLDAVLSARAATMLITHPNMILDAGAAQGGEQLMNDIKACVTSLLETCGPSSTSSSSPGGVGFTAEELRWIISAQSSTAMRSPLTAHQLDVMHRAEAMLPVRPAVLPNF